MKLIFAVLLLFVACTLALQKRDINFGESYGQTPSFIVHDYTCDKFVEHSEFIDAAEGAGPLPSDCFTIVAIPFDLNTDCGIPYSYRYKPWAWAQDNTNTDHHISTSCFPTDDGKGARITLSVVTEGVTENKNQVFFINSFSVKQEDGNNRYKLIKTSYTPSCGDSKAGRCYDYVVRACCEDTLCGPVVKKCYSSYDRNENHRNKIKGGFLYNYRSAGFKGSEGFEIPSDEKACETGTTGSSTLNKKDGESHPFIDSPWKIHKYGGDVSYLAGNGKCCYGVSPAICTKYCEKAHFPVKTGSQSTSYHQGDWYSNKQ